MKEKRYLGEELKITINAKTFEGYSLRDYDFVIEAWCSPFKVVKIDKSEAIELNYDSYAFYLDTNNVGVGDLYVRVVANIPDGDDPDKKRRVVGRSDTNVVIMSPYAE